MAADASFLPGFAPSAETPGHTCNERCWYAKEEVCVCSCGGRNHGIMLKSNGVHKPARSRSHHGRELELVAICPGRTAAAEYLQQVGDPYGGRRLKDYLKLGQYAVESATKSQFKWMELTGYDPTAPRDKYPHLIWKRIG